MSAFTEWAKNRQPFFAMTCHMYASNVGTLYRLLQFVGNDTALAQGLPQPELKKWLKLYRSHRNVLRPWFELPIPEDDFAHGYQLLMSKVDSITAHDSPEMVFQKIESAFPVHPGSTILDSYLSDESTAEIDDESKEEIGQSFLSSEVYFFLRVSTPCWLIYGDIPGRLMRSARQGDVGAIDKILRLDSSAIFDSGVAAVVHALRASSAKKYRQILKAFTGQPKKKLTLQKVKVFIAAYLVAFSMATGRRLTEPEVRALFDAIAQDKGLGEIDTDLPESAEAFAKAIQREVPFWITAHHPDKK